MRGVNFSTVNVYPGKLSTLEDEIFAKVGRHVKMHSWSPRESSRGSLCASQPPQNPSQSIRTGFARSRENGSATARKRFLQSTCASLAKTLREPLNKQYSFRGPFCPGNFLETASLLFSPFSPSLHLFIVSPSRCHWSSFEWSTNFSIVLRAWMATVQSGRWASRGREKF